MPIAACPFCRELFETGEASHCPTCGIALADLAKLPPSPTLREEVDDWDEDLGPEHDRLAWSYWPRGRGLLLAVSLLGMGLFLLPWIDMSLPYTAQLSGWDLARQRGWIWGPFVAWFVLAPTIASRRSVFALRGARVAAVFLSAVPALTATILLALPPRGGMLHPRFEYDWPIYATLVVALVGVVGGVRLGGRLDVMTAQKGSSRGETVH